MDNKPSFVGDFITPRVDDEIERIESALRSEKRYTPRHTPNSHSRLTPIVSRNNNLLDKNKSTFHTTRSLNLNSEYVDSDKLQELNKLLAEKEETIEKLQQLLSDQKGINRENESLIARYEARTKSNDNDLDNREEHSVIEKLLAEKNSQIDELNNLVVELENKNKDLENINDRYGEMARFCDQLKQDNIELEKQLKTRPEKDIKAPDKTLDQYKEHLTEASYNLKLKENECALLKEKNNELKTEVQLLETRLAASNNPDYFERLTRRMQELLESQERQNVEAERLKSVIAEKTRKIEQLISKGHSLNIDLESGDFDEIPHTESISSNLDTQGYTNSESIHYINMESTRLIENKTAENLPEELGAFKGFTGDNIKLKFNDIINIRKGSNVTAYSSLIHFFLIVFIIRTLIWL